MQGHRPTQELYIAIDGGGTKTEFVAFSAEGHIEGRVVLGGSNPNTYGVEAVQRVLSDGMSLLTGSKKPVRAVRAGIAGCGVSDCREELLKTIRRYCPEAQASLTSDIENVFSLAGMEERGIAVISGTGSSAFGKDAAGLHRVGGWGYLLDRAGSGYDLGREALAHTLSVEDGLTPPTLLSGLVGRRVQGKVWEHVPELYAATRDGIAAYAGCVFEAAAAGDRAANAILDGSISRLKELVEHLAKTYDTGNAVVFSGGVTKNPLFREKMKAALPGLSVFFPGEPQIFGATLSALHSGGEPETESFRKTFMKEYEEICNEQN